MARRIPKYRHYKPKNLAVVRIRGKDHYLGRYDSQESWEAYHRLLAEQAASNGQPVTTVEEDSVSLTVVEVSARYLRFARGYYRKDGRPTSELDEVRRSLRCLCSHYGRTLAAEFGPKRLQAVRQAMIDSGKLSRGVINHRIGRIKRTFKWAVAEEFVPAAVHHGLSAVAGLRKGRTAARECPPVEPVDDSVIDATISQLPKVVADMVRVQRLTGCRPTEVCIIRPGDIDRSESVWRYRPESHKTEHHSHERVIFLGPEAQTILRPYLLRPADHYCFSPIESERQRSQQRRENRQTPMTPSQSRRRRKGRRLHPLGNRYTTVSYRRAIHRAVAKVNRERILQAQEEGKTPEDVKLLPKWSPNRLRHTAATTIRKQFGLEAAQTVLGHSRADVTQVYAERNQQLAEHVMRELG